MHLAGVADEHRGAADAAPNAYIESKGRLHGLRERYGIDKTFVVPIMTNLALAGLVDWREIDPLPFELACVPQALVSVRRHAGRELRDSGPRGHRPGPAIHHAPPWNPFTRLIRWLSITPQPEGPPADAARQRRVSRSDAADEFCGDEFGRAATAGRALRVDGSITAERECDVRDEVIRARRQVPRRLDPPRRHAGRSTRTSRPGTRRWRSTPWPARGKMSRSCSVRNASTGSSPASTPSAIPSPAPTPAASAGPTSAARCPMRMIRRGRLLAIEHSSA